MACPDHDLLAQASHRRSGPARACRQEQHAADDGADACPHRNVDVLLLGDLKMRGANIGLVPLLRVVVPGMSLTIGLTKGPAMGPAIGNAESTRGDQRDCQNPECVQWVPAKLRFAR